jgi:hypothetical protein
MKNPHLSIWTENFTQNIAASTMTTGTYHEDKFLCEKLHASVSSLNKISKKIQEAEDANTFYTHLCVYIQEAKNCMYWYKRSLDFELVNLSNSQLILSQGNSMINILEAALKVIKYQ